jgi:hypothetical protein
LIHAIYAGFSVVFFISRRMARKGLDVLLGCVCALCFPSLMLASWLGWLASGSIISCCDAAMVWFG